MAKGNTDQKLRSRNFEGRKGKIGTGAVTMNRRCQRSMERRLGDCWQWQTSEQRSKGNNCSFRHDEIKRVKSPPKSTQPSEPLKERDERKISRRSFRDSSPSGRPSRPPCRRCLRGNCTIPSCRFWHPPECHNYKTESGCKFGNKCAFMHQRAEEQPSKKPKVNSDKTAVALLMDTRQLGCVFQDAGPPKSSSILRESTRVLRPNKRVQFEKATLSHASSREETGPSLGTTCPVDPGERSPYAPKFADRSQAETEKQERCARGDAWRLAQNIFKLKRRMKLRFFLAHRCMVSPCAI